MTDMQARFQRFAAAGFFDKPKKMTARQLTAQRKKREKAEAEARENLVLRMEEKIKEPRYENVYVEDFLTPSGELDFSAIVAFVNRGIVPPESCERETEPARERTQEEYDREVDEAYDPVKAEAMPQPRPMLMLAAPEAAPTNSGIAQCEAEAKTEAEAVEEQADAQAARLGKCDAGSDPEQSALAKISQTGPQEPLTQAEEQALPDRESKRAESFKEWKARKLAGAEPADVQAACLEKPEAEIEPKPLTDEVIISEARAELSAYVARKKLDFWCIIKYSRVMLLCRKHALVGSNTGTPKGARYNNRTKAWLTEHDLGPDVFTPDDRKAMINIAEQEVRLVAWRDGLTEKRRNALTKARTIWTAYQAATTPKVAKKAGKAGKSTKTAATTDANDLRWRLAWAEAELGIWRQSMQKTWAVSFETPVSEAQVLRAVQEARDAVVIVDDEDIEDVIVEDVDDDETTDAIQEDDDV